MNTISPGPIDDTEGVRRMHIDTGRGELEMKKTALGRFGRKPSRHSSASPNELAKTESEMGLPISREPSRARVYFSRNSG